MKRKILILFVAILLIASVATALVACNDTDRDPNTLVLMIYAPETAEAQEAYIAMIDKFTAETGVNVKINMINKDDYGTSLKTSMKTKDRPDVFYLDQPMLADYASLCLDLTDGFYAKENEEGLHKSDFYQVAMDTVEYQGKILAVPFSLTSSVLLYNNKLVKSEPKDWNEWKNMEVPKGKALFAGIGSGGYASWYFQAFLKSAGGEMINSKNQVVFDNANGVAAAQMVKDLKDKSPKGITDSSSAFINGNVMFKLTHNTDIVNLWTDSPTYFDENISAMLFVPQTAGGTSYSNIGGENFAIHKDTANQSAAKELVKFLLREENVDSAIANNFSAIKAYAKVRTNDPITGQPYSENLKKVLGVVLNQLNYASARPAVKNWVDVNDDYLAAALSKILDSGENIQSALTTARQQAESILVFN